MTGRWLTNLALAAVVGLLGWQVLRDVQDSVSSGRLTDLNADLIQRIELKRSGGTLVRLERLSPERWQMQAPVQAPADTRAVERLLSITEARVSRVLPADAAALGRLGLDPARVRLKLDGLQLLVGDAEPVNDHRYVMIGDLVQLIPDTLLHSLLAEPEHYLSRRLLPVDFRPDAGQIDGRALSSNELSGLVDLEADQVQPMPEELGGQVLLLRSADGNRRLRFLVADGGRLWTRLDQRLSYRFRVPPLMQPDDQDHPRRPNPALPQAPLPPG